MTHHIVHDVDRDGWGSAALVLARLGPTECILHPTRSKSVGKQVAELAAAESDVWVLDVPAPADWPSVALSEARVTWVDHHVDAWDKEAPPWVHAILPATSKPTTTMGLLLRHGLAGGDHAGPFVRDLCRDGTEWGQALDGLADYPEVPHSEAELRPLLALGPEGAPLPEALQDLRQASLAKEAEVAEVLSAAPVEENPGAVIVHLADARGVPLARYSLALGRRYPDKTRVIVHRQQRLYCSRDSSRPGLDLLAHFHARGLAPRGHSYVAFVQLGKDAIDVELAALRDAIGAC